MNVAERPVDRPAELGRLVELEQAAEAAHQAVTEALARLHSALRSLEGVDRLIDAVRRGQDAETVGAP